MKKKLFLTPIIVMILLWVFFYFYEERNFPKNITYPCVSYAPYNIEQEEDYSEKELLFDLQKIKQVSNCVRVYSVTKGLEKVPKLAKSLDMKVIVGAWLDTDDVKNDLEVESLVQVAKENNNIVYVVVGNESLLMDRISKRDLFAKLDYVRTRVSQPVTTAEPSQVWRLHSKLLEHVDVIGIHKFPYWEEVGLSDATQSLSDTLDSIDEFESEKPIVVLEIGWPTNGPDNGDAESGLVQQKKYLKETGDFLSSRGIFYNVAEGIDVPSKLNTTEGVVGLHWGIRTYTGALKHIFPIESLILYILIYIALVYLVCRYNRSVFKLYRLHGKKQRTLKLTYIALVCSSAFIAWMLVEFYQLYLSIEIFFQACFTLLAVYAYFESANKFVQFLFADFARSYILNQPKNELPIHDLVKEKGKVSILLAAKDEDSSQIIETIEALVAQTYSDIEILYIDNNSKDKTSFNLVEAHFSGREKIHLYFKEKITGYKAGALNYLLENISTDSKHVAVVDADYIVDANWIETALRYMKADTGFVQFPQAYRLEKKDITIKNIVQVGATVEQRFVFDIVYPIRSLIGNVVQNGTMVVINRAYIGEGWPTYSICEDAALGLDIAGRKGSAVYIPLVMGKGLPPATFKALKKQRNRWVFGAIQVIQKVLAKPFTRFNKTIMLFAIDWFVWFVQALYPILLLSSIGFVVFLWRVYLHLQISWVMLVGFSFVFLSLFLFIASYIKTYRRGLSGREAFVEIFSLIMIECALVNTVAKTVLSGFIFRRAEFVITRQGYKVSIKDLVTLSMVTVVLFFGTFLIYMLIRIDLPVAVRVLGAAQLAVVMFPQAAYMWLVVRG